MTARWIESLLISLGLTLVFELGFALVSAKRGRALVFVALVNVLTNPPLVCTLLIWRTLGLPFYGAATAVLELLAVLIEGFVYQKSESGFRRPYLFSLAANAFSYGMGLVLALIV